MLFRHSKSIKLRYEGIEELPESALISTTQVIYLPGRNRTSIWRDVIRGPLEGTVRIDPQRVRCASVMLEFTGDLRKSIKTEFLDHSLDY